MLLYCYMLLHVICTLLLLYVIILLYIIILLLLCNKNIIFILHRYVEWERLSNIVVAAKIK